MFETSDRFIPFMFVCCDNAFTSHVDVYYISTDIFYSTWRVCVCVLRSVSRVEIDREVSDPLQSIVFGQ